MRQDKGRAIRRHHYERLAYKRLSNNYWGRTRNGWARWHCRSLGIAINTPCPCSCHMCGNRRKYEGKTRSEKKAIISMREWQS